MSYFSLKIVLAMQTQLNQPTNAPIPVTQVQIPLNQNVGNSNSAGNKRTKCLKKVVFILGVSIINLFKTLYNV